MYGWSSELGLYLWGNPPLPTVQGLPPPVGGGPPTMREHFKLLPATVASGQSDSPTMREPPTAHEQWVLLHGGQGSISPQV